MKSLKISVIALAILLVFELVYFNIVFDMLVVALLLLVSYALGSLFKTRFGQLDNIFIQLSVGLGITGMLVWISTFFSINKKSIFLILSILIICIRFKKLKHAFKNIRRVIGFHSKKQPIFVCCCLLILMIYIIPASYPIWQYDSLSKHLAIPNQMANSIYDYNVVEFVSYGDYAIFPHLLYTFLFTLGGTKALVLLNTVLSVLMFFPLIRLLREITKSKTVPYTVGLLYFSMPLAINLSTTLYIDMYPVYFTIMALLAMKSLNSKVLITHLPYIYFIFGLAFFSKPMAVYFILPVSIVLFGLLVYKEGFIPSLRRFALSLITCLSSFLPIFLLIWYKSGNPVFPFMNGVFKSEYFSTSNFSDPFTNVLNVSFQSLYDVVFHTSKNIELENGGVGYFLLALPVAFACVFFLRNKVYLLLIYLIFTSYWLSTLMTYNIRYFYGSIILATIVISVTIHWLFTRLIRIKWGAVLSLIAVLIICIPNMWFDVNPNNYLSLKKDMLTPHTELTRNNNESILMNINKKGIRLLSNNDVYRGTFLGEFYTLTWYNTMFTEKLSNGQITSSEFMDSFDYYLVDKTQKLRMPELFSLEEHPELKGKLVVKEETGTHVLYQVKHDNSIIAEEYKVPIKVNVETPTIFTFENIYQSYTIDLEIEGQGESEMGRWQINWMDQKGDMISTSLVPFNVKDGVHHYINRMDNVPANAVQGLFYITSHNETPVKVLSAKLSSDSRSKFNVVDQALEKYNNKWPHLVR